MVIARNATAMLVVQSPAVFCRDRFLKQLALNGATWEQNVTAVEGEAARAVPFTSAGGSKGLGYLQALPQATHLIIFLDLTCALYASCALVPVLLTTLPHLRPHDPARSAGFGPTGAQGSHFSKEQVCP